MPSRNSTPLGLPFDYDDGFAKPIEYIPGEGFISAEFLTSADRIQQQDISDPDFTWSNNSGRSFRKFPRGRSIRRFSISYSSESLRSRSPSNRIIWATNWNGIQTPSFYGDLNPRIAHRGISSDLGLLFTFPGYNYTFTNKYGGTIQESESDIEPHVWAKYMFNPHGKFSFRAWPARRSSENISMAFRYAGGVFPGSAAYFFLQTRRCGCAVRKLWNVPSTCHGLER